MPFSTFDYQLSNTGAQFTVDVDQRAQNTCPLAENCDCLLRVQHKLKDTIQDLVGKFQQMERSC
jgi:hypothetical protein